MPKPAEPAKKMKKKRDWTDSDGRERSRLVDDEAFTTYDTDDVMVVFHGKKNDSFEINLRKRGKKSSFTVSDVRNDETERDIEFNIEENELNNSLHETSVFNNFGDSDVNNTSSEKMETRKSNKNSPRKVNVYKLLDENKYIVHVPSYKKFCFKGKLRVTVLYGEIEVFGFRVNHLGKNKTLDLYSPRRCMQLNIKSKTRAKFFRQADLDNLLEYGIKMDESELKELSSHTQKNDLLLLAEKLESVHSPIFQHYYDDVDIFYECQIIQEGSDIEKSLGCLLEVENENNRKAFTQSPEWDEIMTGRCTVICGGKGVGKSTLFKYLINDHLSHMECVLCLDLDPGQNEFTAPGSVIATLLKKPLLGPNFTNIQEPVYMAYTGSVNVSLDPVKYIESVDHVIKMCRSDKRFTNIPWFVNTMGFNKGIGLDIMVNIIKILEPDVVIQVHSSDMSKNYEYQLKSNVVQTLDLLRFIPNDCILDYSFYSIKSCASVKGIGFQSGFNPSMLRDFMVMSYFSKVVSFPYKTLNAVQPYWIDFSKVILAIPERISPNYILRVLNASLVGLCNIDGIESQILFESRDPDYPLKVAVRPQVQPSYGIGFVRGIDLEQKKIYLVTPVAEEDLQNVNCLCASSLSPPSCFFLKQRLIDQAPIYVDISRRSDQILKSSFKYIPNFDTNRKKTQ